MKDAYRDDERRSSEGLVRAALWSPAPSYVLATLSTELGSGIYQWTRYDPGAGKPKPLGPKSGKATEVNLTTGIAADTNVILWAVGGRWVFRNTKGGTSSGGGGVAEWYGDGSDGPVTFAPASLVNGLVGSDGNGQPFKVLLSTFSDPSASSPSNMDGYDVLAVAWQGADLDPSGTWPEIVAGDWYFFLQRSVFAYTAAVPAGSHVFMNGCMLLASQALSGAGELTASGSIWMPMYPYGNVDINSIHGSSAKFRFQTFPNLYKYNPGDNGTFVGSDGGVAGSGTRAHGGFAGWRCQPGALGSFLQGLGGVGSNGANVSVPSVNSLSDDQPPPFDEVSLASLNSGTGGGATNVPGAPPGTFAGGTGNGWGFPGGHPIHTFPAVAGERVRVRDENGGVVQGRAWGGTAGGSGAAGMGWGNPGFGGNQRYKNAGTGAGGAGGGAVVVRAKTISGSLKLTSNGANGEPAYQPAGSFFGLPATPAGGGGGGNPGYVVVITDSTAPGITFSHVPGNGGAGIAGGAAGSPGGAAGWHTIRRP